MMKTRKTSPKKHAWFRSVRGSYLPAAPIGYLIHTTYIAYLVLVLAGWWAYGHARWELLVNVVPLVIGAALITQYIASRHSK